MFPNIIMSEKKKALIAYKQKILAELKYYDARIEEISSNRSKASNFEESDSSDSEAEFSLNVDLGPSAAELKLQQTILRICMQATQELTNLQVLQSEVNLLVDDPVFEREPPVLEPGSWREVTAECRVDLVPFSISFCVHQPARLFAPLRYRGLQVMAVKAAHSAELTKSILPSLSCPGDAFEMLKSYSAAHRSRRTTLARLADKYAARLYMEPRADGGYLLKCANLLEVSWTLENKWSPIAPFHHRTKFDLEYMDESYIKIITQAHRQLSDPLLETDERTLLLSKIISTCLEAQGPTQELYESMSSDPETEHSLRKRRTTLDQEPEVPAVKKNKDREVMAPPKSLPKKAKPKGKENMVNNRKAKRSDEEAISTVKRLKTSNAGMKEASDNIGGSNNNDDLDTGKVTVGIVNSVTKENNSEVAKESDVANIVNKNTKPTPKTKYGKADVATDKSSVAKNVESEDTVKDSTTNTAKPMPKTNKISKANIDTNKKENKVANTKNNLQKQDNKSADKKVNKEITKSDKTVTKTNAGTLESAKNSNQKQLKQKLNSKNIEEANTVQNKDAVNSEKEKTVKDTAKNEKLDTKKSVTISKNANVPVNTNKTTKDIVKPSASTSKKNANIEQGKKTTKPEQNAKDVIASNKKALPTKTVCKLVANKENNETYKYTNNDIESAVEQVTEKSQSVASLKRTSNLAEIGQEDKNVATPKKPKLSKPEAVAQKNDNYFDKLKDGKLKSTNKLQNKEILGKNIKKITSGTVKGLKTGNMIRRVSSAGNISRHSADKISKIPQKKLSSSEATLKKNPLRISPRKVPSKFKATTVFGNRQTIAQKTTSIPRLMKKPSPRT